MADAADPPPGGSSAVRVKINVSVVHEEFLPIMMYNPKQAKQISGRRCKACGFEMMSSSACNLKNHLKAKHPDIFSKVQGNFSLISILLFSMIKCFKPLIKKQRRQ